MRTKAEVEAAIRYFQDSIPAIAREKDATALTGTAQSIDLLRWVLGQPSNFAEPFEAGQRRDRADRQ